MEKTAQVRTAEFHHIEAESYKSDLLVLSPGFHFFRRVQNVAATNDDVDAFGNFWSLAFGYFKPGQISVHDGIEFVPIIGSRAMWVPPFSTLRWRLGAGQLIWHSYLSKTPPPPTLAEIPFLMEMNWDQLPRSVHEIEMIVNAATDRIYLDPPFHHPYALKLKKILDRDYAMDKSIDDYAKEIGVSHEHMTRHFKIQYGITPVQYRNKLRLLNAMIDLSMNGATVSQAGHDVGFWDLRHFNSQFKKIMRAPPSQFKIETHQRAEDG
jgi:AraC-like DNA-binding protein